MSYRNIPGFTILFIIGFYSSYGTITDPPLTSEYTYKCVESEFLEKYLLNKGCSRDYKVI